MSENVKDEYQKFPEPKLKPRLQLMQNRKKLKML